MRRWPVGWGCLAALRNTDASLFTALQNQLKCTVRDSLCVVISVLWALF